MPKSFGGVVREFKAGQLHSGSPNGPVVKSVGQMKAIAMSEQRQQGKAGGSGSAKGRGKTSHDSTNAAGKHSTPMSRGHSSPDPGYDMKGHGMHTSKDH